MTQREMYNTIKTVMEIMAEDDYKNYLAEAGFEGEIFSKTEIIEGIDARIEALNKKSSGTKKPTKIQVENEGIYANIIALMGDNVARTNRAITDAYNTLYETDFSTNKIQVQVTKAVKTGELDRSVIKGVVYFTAKGDNTIADDEPVEE